MRLLRNAGLIGLFILSFAQPGLANDDERKLNVCRNAPTGLVGISRDDLRSRCGIWHRQSMTVYRGVSVDALTYDAPGTGPLLVVFLQDGKVIGAQSF